MYPVDEFKELVVTVREHCQGKALFAKLATYANDQEKQNRLELVECTINARLAGVTIPGNWGFAQPRLSRGQASLSGRPTFANNLDAVRAIAAVAKAASRSKSAASCMPGRTRCNYCSPAPP